MEWLDGTMEQISRRCRGRWKRLDMRHDFNTALHIICTCHYKSCCRRYGASSKSYAQRPFQHLHMIIKLLIGIIPQSHIFLITSPRLVHQSHWPYLLPLHLVTYNKVGTSLCLVPQTCSKFLTILSSSPLYFAAFCRNSSVCDICWGLKGDVGLRNEERRWDCRVKRAGFA
jgi:hypothetical protein